MELQRIPDFDEFNFDDPTRENLEDDLVGSLLECSALYRGESPNQEKYLACVNEAHMRYEAAMHIHGFVSPD